MAMSIVMQLCGLAGFFGVTLRSNNNSSHTQHIVRPLAKCRRSARFESRSHDHEKKSKYAHHRSAGPYIYGRLCGFASLVDNQKFLQPLPLPFLLVLLLPRQVFFHFIPLFLLVILLLLFFPPSSSPLPPSLSSVYFKDANVFIYKRSAFSVSLG